MKINNDYRFKVSIIIPAYNREFIIENTLNSILNQSYYNWECLIIDDDSTDLTINKVEDFIKNDKRFKILQRKTYPKGAPTCRNIGIEQSTGDYLIFLDSDDTLVPSCLENRMKIITANPLIDFAVFKGLIKSKKANYSNKLINIHINGDDILRFLNFDMPWLIHSVVWRKNSLRQLSWNETLLSSQDFQFHIDALLKGLNYIKVENEPDHYWHIDSDKRIGNKFLDYFNFLSHISYFSKITAEILLLNNYNYNSSLQTTYFWLIKRAVKFKKQNLAKYLLRYNIENFSLNRYRYFIMYLFIIFSKYIDLDTYWYIRGLFRVLLGGNFYYKKQTNFMKHKYKS